MINRITLFGGVLVDTETGPLIGRAAQRHRLALIALLCSTRRQYRSRDQLIALLWPDADAERGRRLLSDSTYRVNRALGGDAVVGSGEDLRLDRNRLGSDLADFEAAVDARDWRRVVELYTGPFMDGFYLPRAAEYDQWLEVERTRCARMAAKALEALAIEARQAKHLMEAIEWWQRLAALVPDDSRVAAELMTCLDLAGNRAGALREARVHAARLRKTLGVEPDRAVTNLAASLRTDPHGLDAESSIAVLPFTTSGETDQDSFIADGIAEEVSYLLTRTPALRVASRTSALAYRDLKLDVREVARRLDVDWILEGSVRRWGQRRRIVAQLADAATGYQVWSESFDRTFGDDLAIQEQIAAAIAARLAVILPDIIRRRRATVLGLRGTRSA